MKNQKNFNDDKEKTDFISLKRKEFRFILLITFFSIIIFSTLIFLLDNSLTGMAININSTTSTKNVFSIKDILKLSVIMISITGISFVLFIKTIKSNNK
jgi:uncharacterized membrane protein (DUF485 family)